MQKKLIAEFMGTFALVFAGTGAIVINDVTGGSITHLGVALTFGLIVLVMIYALGDVSGAHINPAVTLGFYLAKRFHKTLVLPYITSQFAGAVFASFILYFLFPTHPTLGATIPAGSNAQSFIIELILTFLLMYVILNVSACAKEKGTIAGIAIGALIALEALFAGPISGASMNPARSLAPALVSGQLDQVWIYLLAPILGASFAILGCMFTQANDCCRSSISDLNLSKTK